jgi:predicted nucleic acid-binding protein
VILCDANVLVYASDSRSPRHPVCRQVVERALSGALPGVLVPQVLLEFYAVVTGSRAANPLSPEKAWAQIDTFVAGLPLLGVAPTALTQAGLLARRSGRRGHRVFDTYLACQMLTNGIAAICTDNVKDFLDLGVQPLTPEQVLELTDPGRGSTLHDHDLTRSGYGTARRATAGSLTRRRG